MINSYIKNYKELGFIEKHVAISAIFTVIVAIAGFVLSIVIYFATTNLQKQSISIQMREFINSQNEKNGNRVVGAVKAFAERE